MDIVLITRDRPELTEQCIRSMRENASDWSKHRLLVVVDYSNDAWAWTYDIECELRCGGVENVHRIHAVEKQLGVGGAKNFGAQWYRNGLSGDASSRRPSPEGSGLLMFSDNDMYYVPGWDSRLESAMDCPDWGVPPAQVGGWRHPYHGLGEHIAGWANFGPQGSDNELYKVDAVTGNCFVMRWSDWLKYGPFDSNAIGPGQSEDYALSQRIRAGGGLVATLDPPVAIHCGLVNSVGEPATGWRECEEQITEQLAGLSAEMRNDILIMRPGDIGMGTTDPALERPAGSLRGIAREAALSNIAARITDESRQRVLGRISALNDRVLGQAQERLGMQPRYHGVPLVDERTKDEAEAMYPTYGSVKHSLDAKGLDIADVKIGLNVGSGQRRFHSTDLLRWINIDSQYVAPDRIPDLVCDVGKERLHFDDGCAQYVVLHQVAEHSGCGESAPMLRECWRVLARGGSLIITVPDMRKLAARWLGGELDTQLYMTNVYGAYMGDETDRHKWGFDDWSLLSYLGKTLLPELGTWAAHIKKFDWRTIPGADIAGPDWWILAVEVIKP